MPTVKAKVVHRCAKCNRRLRRWVYSHTTGKRYCVPGTGCFKK